MVMLSSMKVRGPGRDGQELDGEQNVEGDVKC